MDRLHAHPDSKNHTGAVKALLKMPSCPVDDAKNAGINRCPHDIATFCPLILFRSPQQAPGSPFQNLSLFNLPHPTHLLKLTLFAYKQNFSLAYRLAFVTYGSSCGS